MKWCMLNNILEWKVLHKQPIRIVSIQFIPYLQVQPAYDIGRHLHFCQLHRLSKWSFVFLSWSLQIHEVEPFTKMVTPFVSFPYLRLLTWEIQHIHVEIYLSWSKERLRVEGTDPPSNFSCYLDFFNKNEYVTRDATAVAKFVSKKPILWHYWKLICILIVVLLYFTLSYQLLISVGL